MNKMNYAYCRTSTLEQKKGHTIDNQVRAIKDFTDNKIDQFFLDEGISGSKLQRPALDELRNLVSQGKVGKLYLYHPDRLSRTQLHQLMLLDEFQKHGVEINFVSLPEFNNASEESMVINKSVWSMVSELERLRIRERTRLGRINAVKKGKIITPSAPYGYSVKGGKLSINENEIEIAKLILNLTLQGYSERKVIKYLTDKKHKPRNGDVWRKSFINNMLRKNLEFYAGVWHYLKTKRVEAKNGQKVSNVMRNREDWIAVKHNLGIITQQEVSKIRKIRKRNKVYSTGNQSNRYLLSGKVFCSECNQVCYSDSFHGVPYYRCANRRRRFPLPPTCSGGSKKAEVLENLVWEKIKNIVTDKKVLKEKLGEFVNQNSGIDTTQKEINSINNRLKKLKDGYLAGIFELSEVEAETTELKHRLEQIDEIEKKKKVFPKDLLQDIDKTVDDIKLYVRAANFEIKQELVNLFSVTLIYNFDTGEYRINGEFPVHKAGLEHPYARPPWKWKNYVSPGHGWYIATIN